MKGGLVHDHTIIDALDRRIRTLGAATRRQALVRFNGRKGFIDLLASMDGRKLAIEVELSPARVAGDLYKAVAAGAHALWIVVPDSRAAIAVRRRLGKLGVRADRNGVCVLTLGQALQRLASSFP